MKNREKHYSIQITVRMSKNEKKVCVPLNGEKV